MDITEKRSGNTPVGANASPLPSPRRILLIQLRAIGDVILTTPAIRALKRHFPESEIDFLTNPAPAEVLINNPNLRDVLIYPYQANDAIGCLREMNLLRKRRYDVVIDFLGTAATAIMTWASGAGVRIGYKLRWRRFAYTHHEVGYREGAYNALTKFCLLKALGISEEESNPEIFISQEAKDWAERFFREVRKDPEVIGLDGQSVIAIAPRAKRPARQWPLARFAQVAEWLQREGHKVILVWGPGERDDVEAVAKQISPALILAPATSLMQLAAILDKCRLLVCNCGGTKHVAVSVGTPTITIHGPTDPRVWTPPDDPRHAYIRDESGLMEKVSAEQVIQKIAQMGIL